MVDWWSRPTPLQYWDQKIDSIMAIDENGTNDLDGNSKDFSKYILSHDDNDRWFTITGVVINQEEFPSFRDRMVSIKDAHWKDGKFKYKDGLKRVVFHSREIRKKAGPFNPKLINYCKFITDISSLIEQTGFIVYSSSIDKVKHIQKYSNPYHVYKLCLEFIVERYCRYLNDTGKTGLLFLEARGKKEDAEVLKYLVGLINEGNKYNQSQFFKQIKSIFFNPKWCTITNGQASYIQLELADLVSFPIYKFVRSGKKDKSYIIVEKKLYNYPCVEGFGLKKFP